MPPRQPKKLDLDALMEYAVRSLAARAHSLSELRLKLRRRAERAADVDQVLARLKEYGYLDDRRFAELYAAARRDNQGFGKMRVLRDLMARRVAPAVARQAAEAAFQDSDEIELIESFVARKYRNRDLAAMLSEEKNLASVYRRLRHAGFSPGNSIRVLKRYSAQAERLEEMEEPEEPNSPTRPDS